MDTIYIPTKLKSKVNKDKILDIADKLPNNIAVAYSIQYENIAINIKDILSNNKKITGFFQVLGCTRLNLPKNTQAILLIGSGRFHAISLGLEIKLPIYILSNNRLVRVSNEDISKFEKRKKAAYLRFLNANKVGVIVSIKPGQENLKRALDLKNKSKNKDFYLFITNSFDSKEFENFLEIGAWINTACPRLDMDSNLININDLDLTD